MKDFLGSIHFDFSRPAYKGKELTSGSLMRIEYI